MIKPYTYLIQMVLAQYLVLMKPNKKLENR